MRSMRRLGAVVTGLCRNIGVMVAQAIGACFSARGPRPVCCQRAEDERGQVRPEGATCKCVYGPPLGRATVGAPGCEALWAEAGSGSRGETTCSTGEAGDLDEVSA